MAFRFGPCNPCCTTGICGTPPPAVAMCLRFTMATGTGPGGLGDHHTHFGNDLDPWRTLVWPTGLSVFGIPGLVHWSGGAVTQGEQFAPWVTNALIDCPGTGLSLFPYFSPSGTDLLKPRAEPSGAGNSVFYQFGIVDIFGPSLPMNNTTFWLDPTGAYDCTMRCGCPGWVKSDYPQNLVASIDMSAIFNCCLYDPTFTIPLQRFHDEARNCPYWGGSGLIYGSPTGVGGNNTPSFPGSGYIAEVFLYWSHKQQFSPINFDHMWTPYWAANVSLRAESGVYDGSSVQIGYRNTTTTCGPFSITFPPIWMRNFTLTTINCCAFFASGLGMFSLSVSE